MEKRIQTAFRLEEGLIEKLKVNARKNSRSLNNYVEHILANAVILQFPHLDNPVKVSREILEMGNLMPEYTKEEIDSDPRLSAIMESLES